MKGYIYKYTYPNGKVYIGQTRTTVKDRNDQHIWASKGSDDKMMVCERALKKYGVDNVKLETIEVIEVDDKKPTLFTEKLNEAEKKWIEYYDSTDTEKGYNIMMGGEKKTPDQYILEEKWYEIWNKDGYSTFIPYVQETLKSIGKKICVTHEKLTKEENSIWFGTSFRIIGVDTLCGSSTFHSIYKKVLTNDQKMVYRTVECSSEKRDKDIPLVAAGLMEHSFILKSKKMEMPRVNNDRNKPYIIPSTLIDIGGLEFNDDGSIKETEENFNNIMNQAIQYMVEDIRQYIWERIMKKKDKIIKEWYKEKA
jgi:hypothetical protein